PWRTSPERAEALPHPRLPRSRAFARAVLAALPAGAEAGEGGDGRSHPRGRAQRTHHRASADRPQEGGGGHGGPRERAQGPGEVRAAADEPARRGQEDLRLIPTRDV